VNGVLAGRCATAPRVTRLPGVGGVSFRDGKNAFKAFGLHRPRKRLLLEPRAPAGEKDVLLQLDKGQRAAPTESAVELGKEWAGEGPGFLCMQATDVAWHAFLFRTAAGHDGRLPALIVGARSAATSATWESGSSS